MNRNLIYALINFILFGIFLRLGIPIWFLFALLTIYYGYRAYKGDTRKAREMNPVVYGILGSYAVDGDAEDLSYGLYIKLGDQDVFVDIREDKLLEQRKLRASALFRATSKLEENLRIYIERNNKFEMKRVASIGVHSDDIEQNEVFWDPNGHSLLVGFEFV